MTRKLILTLAAVTLLGFGGLGVALIPWIRKVKFITFFNGEISIVYQILIGLAFGLITAKAGWGIVELPILKKTKLFFANLIKPLELKFTDVVIVSICAGIGEELFFRGAMQPLLGVWITAIFFVLLHGYLNPFNLPLTLYGLYMTIVIGVMGLMTEYLGILTAILAHAMIDFILLRNLSMLPIEQERNGTDQDNSEH